MNETATGPLVPRRGARLYLLLEFSALFLVVPIFLYLDREGFGRRIIPTLVVIGAICAAILLRDPAFDRRRLWNTRDFRAHLWRSLRLFLWAGPLVAALTWIFEPELFLRFPRENPRMWLLVMLLYPLFSVYPQELIYRAFLFHRYRSILPTDGWRIAASAVAFALAHLFFANLWAPLLSLAGGWLFARTYARSRSTLQAGLEHGLWGDWIFTVGLGWYFYGGSISG